MTAEIPELAGFGGQLAQFVPQIKQRFIELVNPGEIAELEAVEACVAEAEAAVGIAYNEVQAAADLSAHEFRTVMQPIEKGTGRPWLKNAGSSVQVVLVDAAGRATYREATPAEIEQGIWHQDFAAWQAAQGLAS